jgi:hypothetical protein
MSVTNLRHSDSCSASEMQSAWHNAKFSLAQGCQIFLGAIYQNGENRHNYITNGQNMYQMAVK